eukprot:TRINITY_DN8906_c0_g1_i2.p1 TRINITY_DN8906_c0_g1~~TRINITY_DN8906_c0_g1_i2.p1  ORF type:complete len:246 (-),score=39.78 TRINITY_DN8906_c0_g1_i2:35-772(-)
MCYIQGFMMNAFSLAVMAWTLCIAFNLYMVVVKRATNMEQYERRYHFFSWGLALLFSIIPHFTQSYGRGPHAYWCWISSEGSGNIMRLISWYIPLYSGITAAMILYIMVAHSIRSSTNTFHDPALDKEVNLAVRKLFAYPLVFLILWIFPTINHLYDVVDENEIFFLHLMQALTEPLVGFINAIVYGFDKGIKRSYVTLFQEHGFCLGVGKEWSESSSSIVFSDDSQFDSSGLMEVSLDTDSSEI